MNNFPLRGFGLSLSVIALVLLCSCATSPHRASSRVDDAGLGLSRLQILVRAQSRAIEQVLAASLSEDPFVRANAIEAMQSQPARALPLVQIGVDDPDTVVRFAALVSIGNLGLESLGQVAVDHIDDPSAPVRAAAMYAARSCGQDVDISPMATMLQSQYPQLRSNAAMLLGMMGDASAVPMLRAAAELPMLRANPVQKLLTNLQIAEAIARLGNHDALGIIRAGAYSKSLEVRIMAVAILGNLFDQSMEGALRQMLGDDTIEVQLAAATSLARLGSTEVLPFLLEGSRCDEKDVQSRARRYLKLASSNKVDDAGDTTGIQLLLDTPQEQRRFAAAVRAQAAFGLGLIDDPAAAARLETMLDDPQPNVRLAASAAMLQALNRLAPTAATR